jgi:hypothetical protein
MAATEDAAARRWRPRRQAARRPRPSRADLAGEYGHQHRQMRERWRPAVDAGHATCHRTVCLMPTRHIQPGTPWDLDHTDDRTAWTGPAHRRCNRAAGARTANTQRRARRAASVSREW